MHLREGKPETLKDLGERAETYLEAHSADIVFGIDPKFPKIREPPQSRMSINVDRQDILGPNVHNRLLNHLRRGQVHHSIQLFGQVHLFQHRDRQHFNVVRSGAITVIVSDTSLKIVERDRHRQLQWSSKSTLTCVRSRDTFSSKSIQDMGIVHHILRVLYSLIR